MAETTADVRRDIELTRERMSSTIAELERKLNLMQVVRDHPWPAIAVAAGAGFLLGGSGADMKAASAAASTVAATKGAGSRLGPLLDDLMAKVIEGVHDTLEQRADELVDELKRALGATTGAASRERQSSSPGTRPSSHSGTPSGPPTGGDDLSPAARRLDHGVADAVAGVPPRTTTVSASPVTGEQWSPASAAQESGGAAFHGESRERSDGGVAREQPAYPGIAPGNAPRAD